jgi:hypothetical protein
LYVGDPDLAPLGAVSYMGIPLFDTNGQCSVTSPLSTTGPFRRTTA